MNLGLDRKTFFFLIFEWIACVCAMFIALHYNKLWLYLVVAFFIGTRQHSMLVLFHDAVHHLFAKNKRFNYLIANSLIGVPLNIPLQVYRGLHISHHKYVGTKNDPERILMAGQLWNYEPLTFWQLLVQMLFDLLLINLLMAITCYFKNRAFLSAQAKEMKIHWYWETYANIIIWWSLIGGIFFLYPYAAIKIFLLWNIPLFTINPFFQKIRTFTEHNSLSSDVITNNWTPGFMGRVLIWPYNSNFHGIHHENPNIHWHELRVKSDDIIPKNGGELINHILK